MDEAVRPPYSGVLDQVGHGVVRVDRTLRVVWLNQAAAALAGRPAKRLRGQPCHRLLGSRAPCPGCRYVEAAGGGGPRTVDTAVSGRAFTCRSYCVEREGVVEGFVLLLRSGASPEDWSRLPGQLQAQLGELQRLEALGRLAGAVAHDFNNLLTVIAGCAEIILEKASQPGIRQCADDIRAAVGRASSLVGQLLAFSSRRETVRRRPLDINGLLSNFTDMIRRLLGRDIEISLLLARPLWAVHANPGQMEQVLMNLAVNARDAMPDGGILTLETRNVFLEADPPGLTVACPVPPGEYVLLSVSDTGCGMEREVLEHLFEPFFTTKQAGKGTGLGLSTLYVIVKENRGFIRVHSEPGNGSVFELYFPRCPDALPEARPALQASCPSQ